MKTAFLFSGQGAQHPGMGKDLYDNYAIVRAIFDSSTLDFDVKQLCFEGPKETLDDTQYAQPAIFLHSMACATLLRSFGVEADVCAGLSLGEYSALCYANAFSIEDGTKIVAQRGKIMANALPSGISSMAAILMLEEAKILQACEEVKALGVCEIANYNCPGQIVIGGEVAAVDKAAEVALELKAKRVVPLNVSGPFHTSLLEPASKKLAEKLNQVSFGNMNIPVVFNTTAKELQPDETISGLLTKQIMSSVYLEDSIRYMIDRGIDTFLEIGPGKVLSGFIKKISKDVSIYQVEDVASLTKTLESIKE